MSAGPAAAAPTDLRGLVPLLEAVGDLKRIRTHRSPDSLAAEAFARAWLQLLAGVEPEAVALATAADALIASRLGGIDGAVLEEAGLPPSAVDEVLERAFDAAAAPLTPAARARLRGEGDPTAAPDPEPEGHDEWLAVPDWLEDLARQPRAGATHPERGRLIVEPPESHAEHCLAVAVYAVLLADSFGADPGPPFLTGLAHHLHNAALPDSGFAGEELLGEHLEPVLAGLRARVVAELPDALRPRVVAALALVTDADSPEGRAFNAADVLDRVLQQRHHARAAAFTLEQALEEMELVHPGPLQAFGLDVLREAGLR